MKLAVILLQEDINSKKSFIKQNNPLIVTLSLIRKQLKLEKAKDFSRSVVGSKDAMTTLINLDLLSECLSEKTQVEGSNVKYFMTNPFL